MTELEDVLEELRKAKYPEVDGEMLLGVLRAQADNMDDAERATREVEKVVIKKLEE